MNKNTTAILPALPAKIPVFLNLGVLGLLAGIAFCVQVALVPIWNRLDAAAYVQTMQHAIPLFTMAVKPLMIMGGITFLVRLIRHQPRGARCHWLLLVSFLFFIAAGIITLVAMWPINHQMLDWPAQNPPPAWENARTEWDHLNVWRFACAQLAFLTALISLPLRQPVAD